MIATLLCLATAGSSSSFFNRLSDINPFRSIGRWFDAGAANTAAAATPQHTTIPLRGVERRWAVPCGTPIEFERGDPAAYAAVPGCSPALASGCGRGAIHDFASAAEIATLLDVARRGMAGRTASGGPTIFDLNSGFLKDSDGLVNVHTPAMNAQLEMQAAVQAQQMALSHEASMLPKTRRVAQRNRKAKETREARVRKARKAALAAGTLRPAERIHFSRAEYDLYQRVVERIRATIAREFGLETLHFTAPTFITRQVGNASWRAAEIHDEYWHPHVDKENTAHYDYSALLYLADHGDDFTGGEFRWIDDADPSHDYRSAAPPPSDGSAEWEDGVAPSAATTTVLPQKGRLVFFSAGRENLHQVRRVNTGTRFALSLWFSCDERRRFENFLDGKEHVAFDGAAAVGAGGAGGGGSVGVDREL